jgi:hypothetical protein
MCSLCGVMIGRHWSEVESHPDVFGGSTERGTRIRERQHRMVLVNRVLGFYGLRAREWGNQYTLANRTGKTILVDNLTDLWDKASSLAATPCDPLDPALLAHLEPTTHPVAKAHSESKR